LNKNTAHRVILNNKRAESKLRYALTDDSGQPYTKLVI